MRRGLTDDELKEIDKSWMKHRENSVHGSPFLRLRRHEIEALVEKKHGADHLHDKRAKKTLIAVYREMKKLKRQVAMLEERRAKLLADLEKQ